LNWKRKSPSFAARSKNSATASTMLPCQCTGSGPTAPSFGPIAPNLICWDTAAKSTSGRKITDFHADQPAIDDILKRLAARETLHDYEARVIHKSGKICTVLITSSVRWDGDQFLHTRCFTRDVTDRKRIEDELLTARLQLQLITDNMPAAVTRCSRDLRYVWASNGYAHWLQRPVSDIEGQLIPDVIGAQGFEDIRPYIERVLSGQRVEYTARVRFVGPGDRWIHAVYVPTFDRAGSVGGWVAVVTDVTQNHELEVANSHLAAVIQYSEDGIISKDLDGNILTWNAAAERIYGYTREEAVGKNMAMLLPPERSDEEADILARMRHGECVSHFETVACEEEWYADQRFPYDFSDSERNG
jgi:two-component system sensor histidine kinase VicK